MSRAYQMNITINNARGDRHKAIRDAIQHEWPTDDWFVTESEIYAEGSSSLVGGETEDEYADRISKAIWRANEGYCPVMVVAINLEDLPHETHLREEEDFERLVTDWAPGAEATCSEQPVSTAVIEPNATQALRESAYYLTLDGKLFRRQRSFLLRLATAAAGGQALDATRQDAEYLDGLIELCDSLADQAHDQHGIDCLLHQDDEVDDASSVVESPTASDVEAELHKLGVALDEHSLQPSEVADTASEPAIDVEKLACVKINAPHWFTRADFRRWLNQNELERARDRLATWHASGAPRENSDTFMTYNGGEVSDYQYLPEDILDAIDAACRQRGVNWAVIWLTNVG